MGGEVKKGICRTILILIVTGTFISSQQVFSQTVFQEEGMIDLGEIALTNEMVPERTASLFAAASGDSIEVMEIELEEEKESNIYKEIAVVVIVTAFVGYIVSTVFFPEEEETEEDTGGKDFPTLGIKLSF